MSNLKKYLSLFALGAAGGSIYIIPYIKYVFYDQQIEAMGINNTQSGLLVTAYAIVAIIMLFPGGILADKISPKKLIIISLLGTTVLTLLYAFTFDFKIAIAVWIGFGFSCAFVFWPALIKAIGQVGGDDEQGKMYGWYYALNGILAAFINSFALYISTKGANTEQGFFYAIIAVAAGTFIAMLLVIFFYQDDETAVATLKEDKFKLTDFGKVIRNPYTWVLAIAIFVSYSIYSSNTYFNPFMIDVLGVEPETSGMFTILRTYVFMLFAPVGGYFCDRILKSTGKWYMISFGLMVILLGGVMLMPSDINPTIAGIYTLLPAAVTMAQYGVAWSIQREMDIPVAVMGTAIGISSCISWSPDLFMHTMFGIWLDKYGNTGYTYIFAYLTILAVIGMILGFAVWKKAKQKENLISNS